MSLTLRLRRLASVLLFPFACLAALSAQGQCPAAPSACTPGAAPAANHAFGMGILNVQLGTINNTTLGVRDGFRDYSCTIGTSLTVGVDYPIRVTTNANADENVRVWLDINNDGQFNPTTELVFSSVGRNAQTGTVRIAAVGAVLGTPLRLRVAADYENAPIPSPCSTPQYSQTEDYRVTLQANVQPPAAAFVASQTITCSGCIQFTDQTQNGPTSWLWNFGDNTTSTQQNPGKCYTQPGTYTVTLTATNAAGSTTSTRANYITYDNVVPVAASCTPQTLANCCGYGILRVQLGTFSKTSADGQAGYEDFTCTGKTTMMQGTRVNVSIQTGASNPQDTRLWLDINNDGQFTANELLFEQLNQASPATGSFIVPATAPLNTPLRLRVMSDFVGSGFGPCTNLQFGQAEDYTVTVQPNTQPPATDFTSNYTNTCSNTVQFTDLTLNSPTSWEWNFGDNTASTQQNPSHTYASSGVYTVSLTTRNAFGITTATKTNYIAVTVPCATYCLSTGTNQNMWITNVRVSGPGLLTPFQNASVADRSGYGDYTRQVVQLRTGQVYNLSVTANQNFNRFTSAWIDYNRNGVFESTELVANASSANPFTANFTVPAAPATAGFTRMRVISRLNANAPNPCQQNQLNAETEDYSVNITAPQAAIDSRALAGLSVYPNPSPDGRLRLRLAPATEAGTYSLSVETVLGAVVHSSALRLSPATDAELNLGQLPRGMYVLRLTSPSGHQALRRIIRD